MLRGMATVSYFADDHAAAQAWYTEFLGVEPYFQRPGYAEFRIGDYQHELGLIDRKYVPASMGGAGGEIVYWHVDDLDTTVARLLRAGREGVRADHRTGARVRDGVGRRSLRERPRCHDERALPRCAGGTLVRR